MVESLLLNSASAYASKQISEVLTNFADSTYICGFHLHFAESTYSCGIQNKQLYQLVAESATKQMCRQNLRYMYLYAESTKILLVEFTYILEYI